MSVTKRRIAIAAVLSLGSNLGDREAQLRQAVAEIAQVDGVVVTGVSSIYESAALKPSGVDADAPAYLNAVLEVTTDLEPHVLLDALARIERHHGRERIEPWGDRTLDIDIVDISGLYMDSADLQLPHPQAANRAFVLVPWLELDANATITGHGRVDALVDMVAESVRVFPAEPLQ